MSDREPRFHPIVMLPVIAEVIDGYTQDAAELLPKLRQVRSRPHVFDDALVDRVEAVYGETTDLLPVFEEHMRRWGEAPLSVVQRAEVTRLVGQLARLRPMVEEVLALAKEIRRGTLDRVQENTDLELGLQALTSRRERRD